MDGRLPNGCALASGTTTPIPIAVPLCMHPIFSRSRRARFDQPALPSRVRDLRRPAGGSLVVVAGPRRPALAGQRPPRCLTSASLAWAALLVPPAGAITTVGAARSPSRAVGHRHERSVSVPRTRCRRGAVAASDDLPDDPVRGWLRVARSRFHGLAHQSAAGGAPRGRWTAILLGAAVSGWETAGLVYKTHSLNDVLFAHAIDSCGVESARTRWVRGR